MTSEHRAVFALCLSKTLNPFPFLCIAGVICLKSTPKHAQAQAAFEDLDAINKRAHQ